MDRHAGAKPLLGRELILLLAANFLQQTSFAAVLLVPPFLSALGADRSDLGWLVGIGQGSGAIAAPFAGYAIDRWGRKSAVLVGSALTIAGLLLTATLDRAGWYAVVPQLLASAGGAFVLVGYYVWAVDIIPETRRVEGLCYVGASNLLPVTLGYLPFELGSSGASLRWFFIAAAGAVAASVALTAALLREPPRAEVGDKLRWHDAIALLASPGLRSTWIVTLGFAGILELFATFATVALAHQVPGNPGVFWLLYGATAVVVRVAGARLPGRVGTRWTMVLAWSAAGVAAALIAAADRPAWAAIAGAVGGIAHGYGYPALLTVLVDRAPAHLRGTAMAVLDTLWYVVFLVLAPAMGSLAERAGSDAIIFQVAAVGTWVIAAAWFAWERSRITSRSA